MKFSEALGKLPASFLKAILWFRKSPYFRIFYLVILSLMVAAITLYGFYLGCFAILFSAIVMFALPYWLKERKIRWFAVNGLVVFILATAIFGSLLAQNLSSNEPSKVAAAGNNVFLTNGTVSPVRGAAGDSYTFTVDIRVPGRVNVTNYVVWLNLTTVDGRDTPVTMVPVNPNDWNLTDGKKYTRTIPVDGQIHVFWFSVAINNGSAWLDSPWQFGPTTASYGTYLGFSLYYGSISLILPVSLYFIILMLYWWTQRARAERKRLGMAVPTESTDTGFMCTNCGADVPADAKACPKCGAVFEEAPSSEPTAGTSAAVEAEVGEDPDAKP